MASTEKTIEFRVLLALREAPARGQYDLGRRRVRHMPAATVIEEKRQVPGTGHGGPPVYEYVYRLATAEEKAAYQL